jgi:hypothetical protein
LGQQASDEELHAVLISAAPVTFSWYNCPLIADAANEQRNPGLKNHWAGSIALLRKIIPHDTWDDTVQYLSEQQAFQGIIPTRQPFYPGDTQQEALLLPHEAVTTTIDAMAWGIHYAALTYAGLPLPV